MNKWMDVDDKWIYNIYSDIHPYKVQSMSYYQSLKHPIMLLLQPFQ